MIADVGQVLITVTVVVAALGYVIHRVCRAWTRQQGAGCGSCSRCPQAQENAGSVKQLVLLDGPFNSPDRK
jgi:hypothetical protein